MANKMVGRMMKTVKKTTKEMVTNKYVLYIVLCFAIINVLGFLITNNFIGLTVFALIGLLTSYFTKNMVIVISVTLVASSILHISRVKVEAMTNKKKKAAPKKKDEIDEDALEKKSPDDEEDEDEDHLDIDTDDEEGEDEEDEVDEPPMKKKNKLNHQATVQGAYNNVHGILGSKNFKQMTNDTAKLMQQQKGLTESLNNMAPILENAQNMLKGFGGFGMDKLNNLVGGKKKQEKKTNLYIDMPKRCPPGVFCIENYTIFTIFCILIVALAYIFMREPRHYSNNEADFPKKSSALENGALPPQPTVRAYPRFSFSNQDDILLNPYSPPLSDERYIIPSRDVRDIGRGMPINIRTQGFDTSYRQVGILTPRNGKEQILALMGRPILSNRDKWQYYTMSERNNIKLPISVKGKSCMNEYGCDKVYDGDAVYVEGYGNIFQATIYDNDIIRYIPFN